MEWRIRRGANLPGLVPGALPPLRLAEEDEAFAQRPSQLRKGMRVSDGSVVGRVFRHGERAKLFPVLFLHR